MNSEEKEALIARVQESTREFIEMFGSFDADSINKAPAPDSWTAGQVAEHVRKSDMGMIKLMNGEVIREERAPDVWVASIEELFLDFDIKLNALDFIVPEIRDYEQKRLEKGLAETRSAIQEMIRQGDLEETCTAFAFPGFGNLTRLEIITFIDCHTRRHLYQLKKTAAAIQEPA